jgi:hypothetical protein
VIEFLRGYEGYLGDWLWQMSVASLRTLELMLVAFCLACAIGVILFLLVLCVSLAVNRGVTART